MRCMIQYPDMHYPYYSCLGVAGASANVSLTLLAHRTERCYFPSILMRGILRRKTGLQCRTVKIMRFCHAVVTEGVRHSACTCE